jgi:hypothetical protein
MSDEYNKVQVEAAITGWILTRRGHPAEVFVRWESLVSRLAYLLTSKGVSDE